jgi:ABC-type dipeptide/oligopeptide/nickel transport system permease subunit
MTDVSLLKSKIFDRGKSSLLLETFVRTVKGTAAKVGVVIILVIVVMCIGAPLFAPYGYNDMDLDNMFSHPVPEHIFGTDGLGRDLFSRRLYGGQYS